MKYKVKHPTPTGVRLTIGRFVSNTSRKRFAYASIEDGKASFIFRKQYQKGIYVSRAQDAQNAIDLINGAKYKEQFLDFDR